MTVKELMEYLEDCNPEAEVRLAIQPNWPFEHSLSQIVEIDEFEDDDEEPEDQDPEAVAKPVVYLAEGTQLGYLSSYAKSELGWGR